MSAGRIVSDILDDYTAVVMGEFTAVLFAVKYIPYDNTVIDAYYAASNAAYHTEKRIIAALAEEGISADRKTSELDLKRLALESGLAYGIGLNTLAYHHMYGSRFAIGAVRIYGDMPARTHEKAGSMPCGGCGLCVGACPTGALTGGFERSKCIRDFMNHPDKDNAGMIKLRGDRLLGCDICQRACPLNDTKVTAMAEAFEDLRGKVQKGDTAEIDALIGPNMVRIIKKNL